ncbi:MAG: LD-carboxypeptidase [Lachnospiraceae bacterium]|nr:LD-carboxypeptidase [Lachnospiraceae bacterium]
MFMQKRSKVGIVCCSNGQSHSNKEILENLQKILTEIGLLPIFSDYIYEKDSVFSGTAKERADALMRFYEEEEIKAIFDISGGDLANEILPYLDFDIIAEAKKQFWGYSDLTTIINAIYAKTGHTSVLFQIKNLVLGNSADRIELFKKAVLNGKNDLFSPKYEFVQKETMQGILVGGNIRCLLKLAGTPYWPDMNEKILLLESLEGQVPQIVTLLNQLKQMGVFEKINGILLGTFSAMEKNRCTPDIVTLVKQYAGSDIPIAVTKEIGHGVDSKAVIIGKQMVLAS